MTLDLGQDSWAAGHLQTHYNSRFQLPLSLSHFGSLISTDSLSFLLWSLLSFTCFLVFPSVSLALSSYFAGGLDKSVFTVGLYIPSLTTSLQSPNLILAILLHTSP